MSRAHLQTEVVPGGTLVRCISQAFDELTADHVVEELADLARHGAAGPLYLDLAGVEPLSCVLLGKLLVLGKKLREAGSELCLLNLRGIR